jgi:hypothetical protein
MHKIRNLIFAIQVQRAHENSITARHNYNKLLNEMTANSNASFTYDKTEQRANPHVPD